MVEDAFEMLQAHWRDGAEGLAQWQEFVTQVERSDLFLFGRDCVGYLSQLFLLFVQGVLLLGGGWFWWLVLSCGVGLWLLLFFEYFNFLKENLMFLAESLQLTDE
jgi:hypothetical protein